MDNLSSDEAIDSFAERVFREWKPGVAGIDNGVLLLIIKEQREVRIEVGYGLEGALPDVKAWQIIQTIIVPSFRQGRYEQGIEDAVTEIITLTKAENFSNIKRSPLSRYLRPIEKWYRQQAQFGFIGDELPKIFICSFFFVLFYLPFFAFGVRGKSGIIWLFLLPFAIVPTLVAGLPALVFFGLMHIVVYPLMAYFYESKVMQGVRHILVGRVQTPALERIIRASAAAKSSSSSTSSNHTAKASSSSSSLSSPVSLKSSESPFGGGGGGRSGGGGAKGSW